jgi:hypothetical protein
MVVEMLALAAAFRLRAEGIQARHRQHLGLAPAHGDQTAELTRRSRM